MSLLRNHRLAALGLTAVLVISGCNPEKQLEKKSVAAPPVEIAMTRETLGNAPKDNPWIPHVQMCDLDRDGLMDIVACEGRTGEILWLHQTVRGHFEETVIARDIRGPVHTEAVDIDGDGDLDLLVASMGQIFPNNDKIGSVVILENDGHQHFTPHVVAANIARVCDVRAADLNGDGRLDLAVGQFGYDQGEIRWMENLGNWEFRSHILLDLSGTVNVCIADMDGDGIKDIVALVSQQWEEIFLFKNDGHGNFTSSVIFGSTNEDFGSSGIMLADLNRDGRPDVIYTNGDGFDYAEPGPRPWHGAQWLENLDGKSFKYHRIGDMPGIYSPEVVDFDGDGNLDVLAVSCFANWSDPGAISMMLFHNDGQMKFTPQILARVPTHLLTVCAGDLDGTGKPVIVTGGFHALPPYENISRISAWRQKSK